MIEGKLSFDGTKWKITFENDKKYTKTLFCAENIFAVGFLPDKTVETEISFEHDNTPQKKATKVRPKGEEWKIQNAPIKIETEVKIPKQAEGNAMPAGDFHNPYNFIPAVPRDQVTNGLGDHAPVGHDRFHHDKLTGNLSVTMTVETPLLVLDTTWYDEDNNDHKTFDVLLEDEKPAINPTAIKGMLRSAYEAVTNSRLSVFNKHDERLAFRMDATPEQTKEVFPAVIIKNGATAVVKLLANNSQKQFARLERYQKDVATDKKKGEDVKAITYSSGKKPEHNDVVWVQVDKTNKFAWLVTKIDTKKGTNGNWERGWVYISGANIKNKKYERVFIDSSSGTSYPLGDLENDWKDLISNYRKTHEKELQKREKDGNSPFDYLGDEPGKTAWSRHIWHKDSSKLENGTLCYAFRENGQITALLPVIISRRIFPNTPVSLLPKELRPAKCINELSPADRVFGWVGQNLKTGQKAYRGQVRVGEIKCTNALVEKFCSPLPLNILGQPKPQQGRFYVARDKHGNAQLNGLTNEEAGYNDAQNKGLRGRKVYPHHNGLPNNYWTNPTNPNLRTENPNFFKEYRRPIINNGQEQQDSQNRSVKGWVKPQTTFVFDVHFTNLSQVELGALIWLLRLPANHFHRFGGGKPFGFGSVKLDLTDSQITSGEDLKDFYQSLDDNATPNKESKTVDDCKSEFEKAVKEAYPNGNFLESFLRMAKGFDDNLPIQYPRLQQQPNAEGKNFEWFVSNNKNRKLTLQNLNNENGLPRNPENQQNNQRRRNSR